MTSTEQKNAAKDPLRLAAMGATIILVERMPGYTTLALDNGYFITFHDRGETTEVVRTENSRGTVVWTYDSWREASDHAAGCSANDPDNCYAVYENSLTGRVEVTKCR